MNSEAPRVPYRPPLSLTGSGYEQRKSGGKKRKKRKLETGSLEEMCLRGATVRMGRNVAHRKGGFLWILSGAGDSEFLTRMRHFSKK